MRKPIPSLNALRAFESVIRNKSYRKAAEELRVTSAAVMQLVEKLETFLNQKLILGKNKDLKTTKIGEIAAIELNQGFEQIYNAVNKIRNDENILNLIITSEPSFTYAWLIPRLKSFKIQNPNIDVLIDSSINIVNLKSNPTDIAIRFGVKNHQEDEEVIRLYDEHISAFCSPNLINKNKTPLDVKEIIKYPLLRWDLSEFKQSKNTKICMDWLNWLNNFNLSGLIDLQYGPVFSDYNLALQYAIAGQGIILGSRPVLNDLLQKKLLIDPFNKTIKTEIGYDLVIRKELINKKSIQLFISWIQEEKKKASFKP